MILLYQNTDISDFMGRFLNSIFEIFGMYISLLRSITIFEFSVGNGLYSLTCLDLRIGVLFLQIIFGIVFILSPRLGVGSVFKGNGI